MAIEWIAISTAVLPYVKKYAADRAERLATQSADGALAKIYRRIVPDEKLAKANESFVTRFGKELDSAMDLPTLSAESYEEALKAFLENPSVQDTILAPLDGRSEMDWQLLRGIWSESRLIDLPPDFDWAKVARTYQQYIQRQMLTDADLRPVIQAIAAIRAASAAERSCGSTGPAGRPDTRLRSHPLRRCVEIILRSLEARLHRHGLDTLRTQGAPRQTSTSRNRQ